MNSTNNHYSKFLEQYDWNYFITCICHYRLNTLIAENWVNRLLKADISSKHVHMLIQTNTDMTYKELRFGLGNISVGNYQEVKDKSYLCFYITKHISSLDNYNFIFRESEKF